MPLHDDLGREKGIPVISGGTRLPRFVKCPPGLFAPLGTCPGDGRRHAILK
jgi:hypothetical protein